MAIGYPKNKDSVDTITVQQIERALHSYSVPRVSLADLVFMEEPDSDRAYQDAFEWRPVAVRIVEDRETGYAGDAGASNLVAVKDFRASLRPVWGVLGDF